MAYVAMKYLGGVTSPTAAKVNEVLAALEAATGKTLGHTWGKGSSSEHATGRAVDFMVHNDRAAGDWIANYIWANRRRLNLVHIIWYQRIISTQVSPGNWRTMAPRKNSTENHMDHPHVLFGPGPYVAPSGAAKPVVSVAQGGLAEDGDMGPATTKALELYVGRPADGSLDRMDIRAVQTWLSRSRTGILSKDDVKALQRRVSAVVDGDWGPNTTFGLQRFLNKRNNERKA